MFKFFKKFRQDALQQKSITKYLAYVIGEISLVVIGILIALQVNIWNEQKKEHQVELKILKEIKTDLEENLSEIQGDLASHIKAQNRANLFKDKLLSDDKPEDKEIAFLFSNCIKDRQAYPKSSGYEAMKSKGMEIISNDSIRLRITNLYQLEFSRLLNLGQSNDRNNIYSLLKPYYKKHFILSNQIDNERDVEGLKDPIKFYDYELKSFDIMKKDQELLMDLQESFAIRKRKISSHQHTIEQIESTLNAIGKELEKNNN